MAGDKPFDSLLGHEEKLSLVHHGDDLGRRFGDDLSAGFAAEVSRADDVWVVALSGELDLASAPQLSQALSALPGASRVRIDLTNLDFLDSTGIKTLLAAARRMEASGGTMTLFGPRPNVQRIFELVALRKAIPIELDNLTVADSSNGGRVA